MDVIDGYILPFTLDERFFFHIKDLIKQHHQHIVDYSLLIQNLIPPYLMKNPPAGFAAPGATPSSVIVLSPKCKTGQSHALPCGPIITHSNMVCNDRLSMKPS